MGQLHLFLIGYRGTGKTTVGKELAQRLARPWVDTDRWIEQQSSQSIPRMFAEWGEEFFRDWETRAIQDVCRQSAAPSVVSLGGGAVLRPRNRELLLTHGKCVWLRAATIRIAERLAADIQSGIHRPGLTTAGALAEIEHVLMQREPLYRDAADWQVDTDAMGVNEIVESIADWFLKQN